MKKAIKEFIIEEHANACSEWKQKIEERYPELFKKELEKGKWYKLDRNFMFCFNGNYGSGTQYGFTFKGLWSENLGVHEDDLYTPATKEEVQSALIAEVKRRGYKNGNYKCLYLPNNTLNINDDVIEFDTTTNALWLGAGGHSNQIFCNGKWAKIIEEEKPSKVDIDRLKIVAELTEIKEKLSQIESKL